MSFHPDTVEPDIPVISPAQANRDGAGAMNESALGRDETDSLISEIGLGRFPGVRAPLRTLLWLIPVIIEIAFLVGLLAALAAILGLSLLTLGFMLAAEAGLARSGRLRDAVPLLPISTRIGTILIMVGLFLLPLRLLATLAAAHGVIAQSSPVTPNPQRTALFVAQVLIFVHMAMAVACGGSPLSFLRPVRNMRRLARGMRDGFWFRVVNHWSRRLLGVFRPGRHLLVAICASVGAIL